MIENDLFNCTNELAKLRTVRRLKDSNYELGCLSILPFIIITSATNKQNAQTLLELPVNTLVSDRLHTLGFIGSPEENNFSVI